MERRAIEALLQRWLTAIRDGNPAAFDELLTADVSDHSSSVPTQGRETFKVRAAAVHAAFTELETCLDELLVDGDSVAWRWRLVGVHSGVFAGISATGRRVTLRGVNFQRLVGGRVAEHWTMTDTSSLLAALGGARSA